MRDLSSALKKISILSNEQRSKVLDHFEKNRYKGMDEFQLKNLIHQMRTESEGGLSRFAESQVEHTLSKLTLPDKDDEESKPKRKLSRF